MVCRQIVIDVGDMPQSFLLDIPKRQGISGLVHQP